MTHEIPLANISEPNRLYTRVGGALPLILGGARASERSRVEATQEPVGYMIKHSVMIVLAASLTTQAAEFEAWPRRDENSQTAHRQLLEKARSGKIDLYFLGDSITRRWGCTDRAYTALMDNWKSHFYGWNAANFGWGGDTTHSVLWRVQNGELEGVHPKVIVLQAGANDIGSRPYSESDANAKVEEVVAGISAILAACQERAPKATVILTGVFPRSDNREAAPVIASINDRLEELAERAQVRFVNINAQLSDGAGGLKEEVTVDGLHLSAGGYDVWAEALEPHLKELLGPRGEEDFAPPPTGNPAESQPRPPSGG